RAEKNRVMVLIYGMVRAQMYPLPQIRGVVRSWQTKQCSDKNRTPLRFHRMLHTGCTLDEKHGLSSGSVCFYPVRGRACQVKWHTAPIFTPLPYPLTLIMT